jgi:WD40 repeat protein
VTAVATATLPGSPFRGLSPFGDSEVDALLFFGREREAEVIAANLMAAKLTVLYGPSGVGKTSVVRAGVTTRLRATARTNRLAYGEPGLAVAVVDGWSGDAAAAVRRCADAAVADALGTDIDVEADALPERLAELAGLVGGDLFLVLDQFEEYFLYHGDERGEGTMAHVLPELVRRTDLPVSVLVSLRDDALAQLDAFKADIPGLFANSLRLDRLSRRAARDAMQGPIDAYNALAPDDDRVAIEPALVDAVLDQVAVGRIERGVRGRGVPGRASARRRVEAPYLQLVLQRIWSTEREAGSPTLRLETLDRLGGAGRIVEDHLEGAIERLSDTQRDVAAAVFNYLVTPSGTKIAHRAEDLARYAHVEEDDLRVVLSMLASERLVRPLGGDQDGDRYEIFHDVLADAVLAWRSDHEAQRMLEAERAESRRRHRRVLVMVGIALAGLFAMTAIAIFAVLQRGDARASARSATAREHLAQALADLEVDPQRSLALALDAAEREPNAESETLLRRTLIEARLRHVLRTGSQVSRVVFSADGRRALVGSANGAVAVWNPREGVVERTLHHGAPLFGLSVAPTGNAFLTAGGRQVRVWRGRGAPLTLSTRAPIAAAEFGPRSSIAAATAAGVIVWPPGGGEPRRYPQPGSVRRAVLNADESRLATVVVDGAEHVETRLYDTATGRLIRHLPLRGISDVEFSPDGTLLATSSHNGSTLLWRAGDGGKVRELVDYGNSIVDLEFDRTGSLLATASSDGGVRAWSVARGERTFFFVGHDNPVDRVVFSPDGEGLASLSSDGTARLWAVGGVEAGSLVALMAGHRDVPLAAAFSPGGRWLVTGAADGVARAWDSEIEQELAPIGREGTGVTSVALSADGRLLLDAAADLAHLRRVRDGRIIATFPHERLYDAALAPDGTTVATASDDGTIRLWDRRGMRRATLRHDGVRIVRFAPAGEVVATAGYDGTVRLWRAPTGEALGTLAVGSPVNDVAFGRGVIATASADGTVRLWSATSHRPLRVLGGHEGEVTRVRFSPDGTTLVTAGADGTARLWRVSGELLHVLRGHTRALTDARFDSRGRRLVTTSAGDARNVILWDVETGRPVHFLVGHYSTVTSADFSSDDRWIVTAGPISAGLWPVETGRLLFYVRGHTGLLTSVAFIPGTHRVLTSSRDGTVRVYDCEVCRPLDDLERVARARLAAAEG